MKKGYGKRMEAEEVGKKVVEEETELLIVDTLKKRSDENV